MVLGYIIIMVLVALFIIGALIPILNLFHINEQKSIPGDEFPMDYSGKGDWQILNQT
jgi:hypothetical protein